MATLPPKAERWGQMVATLRALADAVERGELIEGVIEAEAVLIDGPPSPGGFVTRADTGVRDVTVRLRFSR